MTTPERILIVNPFGIGDVLFSTPLVRALRCAFPRSFIGYLCNRRTAPILKENPHVDELFIYEKDELTQLWRRSKRRCVTEIATLLRRLRQLRFDVVVDLSLGERYGLLTQLLGIPRRVGFNYRQRGRFLNESLTIDGYHGQHVVRYYERLLEFLGVRLHDGSLELQVSAADYQWTAHWLQDHHLEHEPLLVGIVPAGGVSWGGDAPFRRWNLEGFAAVADALVERYGVRILLFGEAADVSACETVARLMHTPSINVSGQTTLGQFVSLLSRLGLVICNDGGPLHLAVGRGVKTVSIFGPVDPEVYGPYVPPSSSHPVVYRSDLPCRPCYHQFKLPPCPYDRACLTTIEPDEVLEACVTLLDQVRQPAPRSAPVD